ncbi:MAG: deoxyribose-phosphate aldolase [Odoribacteraceae bacterium]|jgi:deoxyribose-phosphate aldolase|nr:deoxyribose-phosphate aldolase [Odoribacteraceae bacterium]
MNILDELTHYRRPLPSPGLAGAIEKEAAAACSKENLALCLSCMDYTSLEPTDTEASLSAKIAALREKLRRDSLPPAAAVCVFPRFAGAARQALARSPIKTAVAGGGFPSAGTFARVKLLEYRCAIEAGAEEIDAVAPAGEILEKRYQQVYDELALAREACAGVTLKVIIETGELRDLEAIFRATLVCAHAGADFVKTSTGKTPVSATPEAVLAMCEALRLFYIRTGRRVGVKVAGGIAAHESAILYMTIVRRALGEEWLAPRHFRIGASRLLDDLAKRYKSLSR